MKLLSPTFLIMAGFAASSAMYAQAQEKTLRIAMTAGDIPRTTGQPDQGFEGNRFTGIPMYDALTQWDLASASNESEVIPNLAVSWKVDEADKTKWVFKLRPGVKFHDGSPFNADAVVFNVRKVLDKDAPQFDPLQVGVSTPRFPTLRSARKIDDLTVELVTSQPDAFVPTHLTNLFMASPAQWEKKLAAVQPSVTDKAERSKQAWAAFALDPAGTGPFKQVKFVPRERLEMVKNPNYWDPKRRPKIDRVVLLPLPEANSRTAALLSGQVDWVEAPAPDSIAAIKARGFKIYANAQPAMWSWILSTLPDSPFKDKKVRQAANLCVDRAAVKELLGGMMVEATGIAEEGESLRGNPTFKIRYDVAAAKKLMQESGYSASKPAKVKVQVSASGSGQMQPLPMNEFMQQNLKDCYFDVQFDLVEWSTMLSNWRLGAKDQAMHGSNAFNMSFATVDPSTALIRNVNSKSLAPTGTNWGYFNDATVDALGSKARITFDDKQRTAVLSELQARITDEAPNLFVAHDVGPRAISPKVKGVVQPKNWFIDLATMSID